jgi:hypothetical protein
MCMGSTGDTNNTRIKHLLILFSNSIHSVNVPVILHNIVDKMCKNRKYRDVWRISERDQLCVTDDGKVCTFNYQNEGLHCNHF